MKFVSYSKSAYYFLTDEQFENARGPWALSQSVYVDSIGVLLPPPRTPAGVLPEHQGMEIAYCWTPAGFPGSPGWVAFSPSVTVDGEEKVRSAFYYRAKNIGSEDLSYEWREVNVKRPNVIGGFDITDHGTTSEDLAEFMKSLKLTSIDDVLSDPGLRSAISFSPLLPSYFLE